jgi:hypothetical protein
VDAPRVRHIEIERLADSSAPKRTSPWRGNRSPSSPGTR